MGKSLLIVGRSAAALCLCTVLTGRSAEIRTPEAPFTDGRAQSVEVPEARIEQDAVIAGTKRLQINSQLLRLASEIENEQTWMMHVSSTPGLPWGVDHRKSPIKVEIAPDGRSVTRSLRMEGAQDVPEWQRQAPGRFRQTVRLLGKDACRIETEVAFDDGQAPGATGQGLRVPRRIASDARIVLRTASGERSWTVPTFNLWDKGREKFSDRVFSEADPLELVFDADRPEGSFSFSFERGSVSRISCSLGPEYVTFSIVYAKPLNGGTFAMDFRFRECPVYDSRGSVEGVNFRRANAFEVPLYDAQRNFFLNPSFESDARYWQNVQNGFDPNAHLVTNDVHSGRFALSLVKPAQTFSFPVRTSEPYTLSFWARSASGGKASGGVHPRLYAGKLKGFNFTAGAEWRRFAWTFRSPRPAIAFAFSGADVVVDDLQLEPGEKATAYAGNPFGIVLRTDQRDEHFADVRRPINARLVLRGSAGSEGTMDVAVEDFFGRQVFACTNRPFAVGACGETVPLAFPDTAFAHKGVNRIRLAVRPQGGIAFVDHLRLATFVFADGTAKNRFLHQMSSLGSHSRDQLEIDDVAFRMAKATGVCPRCRPVEDAAAGRPYDEKTGRAVMDRYAGIGAVGMGWTCMGASRGTGRFVSRLREMGFENPARLSAYSNELVTAVERLGEEMAAAAPWVREWVGPNEVSANWPLVAKPEGMREFVKLMMALHRGIHKGNPDAVFMAYSTCNGGELGRAEVRRFLSAAREVDPAFRFDAIDVHQYRQYAERPDVDADYGELMRMLDETGNAGMSVYGLEGGYFYPLCVNQWAGVAPWAGIGTKDRFAGVGVPSYDLGWGERIAAAQLLTYNLAAYKYALRLKAAANWWPRAWDNRNPVAGYVATAAQTELLGNARFLKDVRFGDGARCYVFDDGKGHAVVVFWKFDEEMIRGRKTGGEIGLDLLGMDPSFFDMMANEVSVPVVGGRHVLPLGPYPVYVVVPISCAEKLAHAFVSDCRVSGRKQ